jgi:hypothetical protein
MAERDKLERKQLKSAMRFIESIGRRTRNMVIPLCPAFHRRALLWFFCDTIGSCEGCVKQFTPLFFAGGIVMFARRRRDFDSAPIHWCPVNL